jgi:sterol 3beta-glucosyltransferase
MLFWSPTHSRRDEHGVRWLIVNTYVTHAVNSQSPWRDQMKIAIVCNDTRGGVQPYVALGLGLASAGHCVRAVAPAEFVPMFNSARLAVAPLSGGADAAEHRATDIAEKGVIAAMRYMARELPGQIDQWTRETLAACDGVELMTGGIGGMVTGLSVAEKLRVPFIETHLQPIGAPTDGYPGIMLPWWPRWLGRRGLHLSHYLSDHAVWMAFKGPMASARKRVLGLDGPQRTTLDQPRLYGFSRHVVPLPTGGQPAAHVCGYWTLPVDATWVPPPKLTAFLAGPGPVVSIGFGSMASTNPTEFTDLVVSAVRRAGVRAVVLSGWGGLKELHDVADVFCAESLPHDWLFSRVAAVVHHGGAGTTGAALSAGVPAIVVPFAADQPFWGARVAALGCGPPAIPRKRLSQDNLAQALQQTVASAAMRSAAAELGTKISADRGVDTAVARFGEIKLPR